MATTEDVVSEYERRHGYYVNVAARMVGKEDAEDMVQQSFMRVLSDVVSFRGECALKTWLTVAVKYTCLDALRKKRAKSTPICIDIDPDEVERVTAVHPHDGASEKEDRMTRLRRAIPRLRPLLRLAIEMDLAETVPSPAGNTVKVRKHRAVCQLRHIMGVAPRYVKM